MTTAEEWSWILNYAVPPGPERYRLKSMAFALHDHRADEPCEGCMKLIRAAGIARMVSPTLQWLNVGEFEVGEGELVKV